MKSLAIQDLECSQSEQVMVSLGEAWIVLLRGEIAEGRFTFDCPWEVYSIGEEDLVIDEHLLASALIGVQWSEVSTNDTDCSLDCSIEEIVVDLGNSSVPLNSLNESILGEVLNNLEFFIPVSDSSRVKAIQRKDCGIIERCSLLRCLSVRYNPSVALCGQGELSEEVGLCCKNRVQILLEVLSERRRDLEEAADESVGEARVSLLGRAWSEVRLLRRVVSEEAIHRASDTDFAGVSSPHSDIEKVSDHSAEGRHWIEL